MKNYKLTLHYAETKKGLVVGITRTAELSAGDYDFKLRDISAFLDDVRKIYRDVKRLAKVAHYVEIELTVAEYKRHGSGAHSSLSQENFDCWTYNGNAEEEGIHLEADPRYTEEYHDMWLDFGKFDPLNDITA